MFGSLVPWKERFSLPASDRFAGMFDQMEREMRDLVGDFWGSDGGRHGISFVPSVDLVERENEYEVTVDLPGLKPEEVHVELKGDALWITGERKEEKEEKDETYHRIERRHGEFRRILPLPTAVSEDEIDARFVDGELRVVVPKSEQARTKHIEVKS